MRRSIDGPIRKRVSHVLITRRGKRIPAGRRTMKYHLITGNLSVLNIILIIMSYTDCLPSKLLAPTSTGPEIYSRGLPRPA